MAEFSNPAFPNCNVACDRCGSPLLEGIKFTGKSHETGEFVSGVFGPDCIYHLTGDKNPKYNTVRGVYDPAAAKAKREESIGRYEREEAERRANLEALRDKYTPENAWLIDVLRAASRYNGDFCSSMGDQLLTSPLSEEHFSFRCLCIIRDIYAKSFGRKNSKAHIAAEDFFDSKVTWKE